MIYSFLERAVDAIRLRLVGPNLLQDIPLLQLRTNLEEAIKLYGDPIDRNPNEDLPNSEYFTFEPSKFHQIRVFLWKSQVHAILYCSAQGDPDLDIKTMFECYGEAKNWVTIDEGYKYRRQDGQVRLWCSALPMIGVGSEDYVLAKEAYKGSKTETKEK